MLFVYTDTRGRCCLFLRPSSEGPGRARRASVLTVGSRLPRAGPHQYWRGKAVPTGPLSLCRQIRYAVTLVWVMDVRACFRFRA